MAAAKDADYFTTKPLITIGSSELPRNVVRVWDASAKPETPLLEIDAPYLAGVSQQQAMPTDASLMADPLSVAYSLYLAGHAPATVKNADAYLTGRWIVTSRETIDGMYASLKADNLLHAKTDLKLFSTRFLRHNAKLDLAGELPLDRALNISSCLDAEKRADKLFDAIKREVEFDVDTNPTVSTFARHYYAAVLCEQQRGITAGEILGIWLKEGSARWPKPQSIAEAAALAPTRFRENWYYISMGLDDYCLTIATAGDNVLSNDTAKAQTTFVDRAGKATATAIMAELVSTATTDPKVTKVVAKPWFVVRSMLLASDRWRKTQVADKRFQDVRARYMQWNMKQASFRAFMTSALTHSSTDMGLKDPLVWAFHTKVHSPNDPVVKEYNQARINAVKFWHYLMAMPWRVDVFRDQLAEGAYKDDVKKFTDNTPYDD